MLTSISEDVMNDELLIPGTVDETVMKYALNAQRAGLDGVVCSPLESGAVHSRCGKSFLTVTPGVRFSSADAGDQARVTDPAGAKALGSDYIVVGRPITAAADPAEAYGRCIRDFIG